MSLARQIIIYQFDLLTDEIERPNSITNATQLVEWTGPTLLPEEIPQPQTVIPDAIPVSHPIMEWRFEDLKAEKNAIMINGPVCKFSENTTFFSQTKFIYTRLCPTDAAVMVNGPLDVDAREIMSVIRARILREDLGGDS